MNILIVDCDRLTRDLAAEVIEGLGHTAFEAANAREALAMAQPSRLTIGLLLTAVMLPTTSGLELAVLMRKLFPDLKVIYMSTPRDAVRVYGPLHSGSGALHKPFTREQLAYEIGLLQPHRLAAPSAG